MSGLDLKVPLGLGTMYWGDTPLDRAIAGKILSDEVIAAIRDRSRATGITLVDTAEGYGGGTSEARLGRLRFADSGHLLATKFLPTYWRWTSGSFVRSQSASNRRLGIDTCDLCFVHSPVHPRKPDVWIRGAARAYRQGTLKALGLSNFNAEQVIRAARLAREEGIPLVANQLMFSLLVYGSHSLQDTLQASREEGLAVLGYSVLGQGLLMPSMTPEKLAQHHLARRIGLLWDELIPLRETLFDMATRHQKTISQICLQWAIGHGIIPLVGTRSVEQLDDTLGCLTFTLSDQERQTLDNHALSYATFDRAPWKRLVFLGFLSTLMTAYKISALWPKQSTHH